ncbi:MAG TPA: DUF4157 domain-containing protein [Chitinophagaceae bacterium]|nr:DUF4157 domain-containing protein [Chitinophagaceae bacterium]
MSTVADKVTRTVTPVQRQADQSPFFSRKEDAGFFGNKESFFPTATIQAKLSVSSPDDPQEKEADAMADHVMRMPEPAAAPAAKEEEKLQKKEEDKKEEQVHAKLGSSPVMVQTKCESCEKEDKAQAKLFRMIQRSEDGSSSSMDMTDGDSGSDYSVDRKHISLHHSDVVQRSGRGPPGSSIPFDHSLSSSKGSGSALPGDTRQFMESRFNADFSGVRIHTGSYAESMSSQIHAQAFTHGNDIYFNAGKFSPSTSQGSTLLAHELTHTIQQGASQHNTSTAANSSSGTSVSAKPLSVSRKEIIHRSADVPVQLTNAVEKAKTVEGKIDANKPQADGNRTGWENLVEIFKTTFGEDKIISGAGGSSVKGAVAEEDIKKKRETSGAVVDKTSQTDRNSIPKSVMGTRDAMPSWCGIFVFWALNKSGVPMPKWQLGERMIKPEAARLPGVTPLPGDIAYRNAFSHFAIVESVNGNTVTTVNGNTAGEDNLGGQVQTKDHPIAEWTAFFNPLLIMQGNLGSGEGPAEEKPKTLRELRSELFNVNRKEDPGITEETEETNKTNDTNDLNIGAKPELSSWSVNGDGALHTSSIQPKTEQEELQKKDEEPKEEEKTVSPKLFTLQAKACNGCGTEHDYMTADMPVASSPVNIQNKGIENTDNSSLTTEGNEMAMPAETHSRGPPVQLHNNGNTIQCGWFDDALSLVNSAIDFVAEGLEAGKRLLLNEARDFVMAIPGYKALRVVLGSDPITGEEIERNGHNFIEAAFDIMPGGNLLYDKLNELGALDEAAQWIDNGIAAIEGLVRNVVTRVEAFWNGITLESLASPSQIFEDAGNIIHSTISSIVDYAVRAATELLEIVKRWLLTQVVGFIRERTTAYPLLCVIIGQDPITEETVERNGTNILSAILELGGEEGVQQRTQMQETGTFQKAADWIDRGIGVFSNLLQTIRDNFGLIWSVVSIDALMHPIDKFTEIYNTFAGPVMDVLRFVGDVARIILQFIKEALMQRLSAWARTVRGYYLVTVIIGKDPFTDAVVERNVENIIHGFMSLMDGGEEQFNQMKESGAIARATQRIDAAVARLNMTPASIVQLFIDLWNSFSINDLADPIAAFQRIIATFGEPIGRLIAFVVEIVKIVVVVILEIMNFPFDLINNIITRTIAAFHRIKNDPIGFLKNLLRAIKQGFIQFFNNIVTHLINGVVGWLMSELRDAGIPELTDFSLRGVIGWVLEVLGISMEKIWEKLAAHPRIGPERVARLRSMINTLDGIWTFIKDVQERGIAAIWEKIQEQLTNLWNTVIDAVKNWVMERIVTQVTARLLSMLDPTGIMAVVNSCIAIYSAIQSFIKYLRQMLEVINSFVNGVADIAEGNVTTAANYLENTMGRAMPIVIGFLANQVGLGGIGRRVGEMIERVREMVDQALTWLVNRAVDTGFAIFDRLMVMGASARDAVLGWLGLKKEFNAEGETHKIFFKGNEASAQLWIASDEIPFPTLLANKQTEINGITNATTKANKQSAWNSANGIYNNDIVRIKTSLSSETDQQRKNNYQNELNMKFNEIVPHLLILGIGSASGQLPDTIVQLGSPGGKASWVEADPLTKNNSRMPRRASANPPGWVGHIDTIEGYESIYERLHLLHFDLGGRGTDTGNLTPGTRTENGNMYNQAEGNAITLVHTNNRVLWYRSEITGYRTDAGFTDFAEGIRVKYGFKEKNDSNEWVRVGDVIYDNVFPLTKPSAPGPRDPVPSIRTMAYDYWESVLNTIPGRPTRDDYRAFVNARNRRTTAYSIWTDFTGSTEFLALKAKYPNIEQWFLDAITAGKLRGI